MWSGRLLLRGSTPGAAVCSVLHVGVHVEVPPSTDSTYARKPSRWRGLQQVPFTSISLMTSLGLLPGQELRHRSRKSGLIPGGSSRGGALMNVHWVRSNGILLALLVTAMVAVGGLTALVLHQQQDQTTVYEQVHLETGPAAGAPPKASTSDSANAPARPAPQVVPAPQVQVVPAPRVALPPQRSLPQTHPQKRAHPILPPPRLAPNPVTPAPETNPATDIHTKKIPPDPDQAPANHDTSETAPAAGTPTKRSTSRPAGIPTNPDIPTSLDATGNPGARRTALTPGDHDHASVVDAPSDGDQFHHGW
jgi:hypothetical protein